MADLFSNIGLQGTIMMLPGLVGAASFNLLVKRPQVMLWIDSLVVLVLSEMSARILKATPLSALGAWESLAQLVIPIGIAISVVTGSAKLVRSNDRKRRSSRGNEERQQSCRLRWYEVFRAEKSHLILHLKDGRKVFGWPEGWPEDSTTGHFLLTTPLVAMSGQAVEFQSGASAVLLPAQEVSWVQFLGKRQARSLIAMSRTASHLPMQY
ncbi:DUF6338 family protein [Mitsuaria sp. 7]|uniref:DUF6338 family protein n=1 Tax=Mitsuaria sp. 7 TaxID=1658665 RepID=UPI0012F8B153|nr:DUF6338 family protein [Mitsuaria sp. 7]